MKPIFKLVLTAICLLKLTGCAHTTQTTSGSDYLSRYPAPTAYPTQAQSQGYKDIDAEVAKVAAIEPNLQFPARIGIVRVERGDIANMSQAEGDAWFEAAQRLGRSFGEFIPINPLVAEMVTDKAVGTPLQNVIRKVRLGAARQHLDVVLLYEVYGKASSHSNFLSVMDLTIIGAYISPGQSLKAEGYAKALLLDVRSGYPYGSAEAVANDTSLSPLVGSDERSKALYRQTSLAATQKLTVEVEKMMQELKQRLTKVRR